MPEPKSGGTGDAGCTDAPGSTGGPGGTGSPRGTGAATGGTGSRGGPAGAAESHGGREDRTSHDGTIRRVLLIGFMASGKTTVGRLLAERLGWRFYDVDEEIVRRSGQTVPEIFREHGETVFRALEARLAAEIRSADNAVIAPGGGWVTTPGALDGLPEGTFVVWLRVSAEEAVRRVGGGGDRPLLAGPDPLDRARTLLAERESLYRRADLVLDVDDRTVAGIVEEIAARIPGERTSE